VSLKLSLRPRAAGDLSELQAAAGGLADKENAGQDAHAMVARGAALQVRGWVWGLGPAGSGL
jgi:hypothetical protein